jgi:hypothetical protein
MVGVSQLLKYVWKIHFQHQLSNPCRQLRQLVPSAFLLCVLGALPSQAQLPPNTADSVESNVERQTLGVTQISPGGAQELTLRSQEPSGGATILLTAPQQIAGLSQAPTGADANAAKPAPTPPPVAHLDIYGFAMLDNGYDFGTIDPEWFDVVRPTKLPSFRDEFGRNGNWFAGVRQTRLGFKGYMPTSQGEIRTIFEFELFGTGVDAGQTTFRLRHAWGEYRKIGAGQFWSVFMDPDVFPNSIEYWGPNGMVFFRNVQLRYTPWSDGDSNFMVALERPGASADQGTYASRIELENTRGRFRLPDFTSHVRIARNWGHVQLAAIVRDNKWDDLLPTDPINLDGGAVGWGVNLSSNIKVAEDVIRLQAAYGEGIQNYMNDAPVDIGIVNNFSNRVTPILGKALPILGIVAFLDHKWSDKYTSSIGYSLVDIDNSDGQTPRAFKRGQYGLANLLWHPLKDVMMGGELQWGRRANKSDGFIYNDYRIQFSFKYNFSFALERR